MPVHSRPDRAVFRFSGSDAQKLLDDVVTGRMPRAEGSAAWWALLSPQGKIQAEGLAGLHDGAYWLDVHAGVADAFFKRMRLYKLRAKAEIDDLRGQMAVGWTAGGPEAGIADRDGRCQALGWRIIAATAETSSWDDDDTPWHWARISEGIAELGPDYGTDSVFPHDVGMDLLGGVDFKKGCYVGQEVVSRMQHRGTARRRPVIVSDLPEGAAAGTGVMMGEREAGTIGVPVNGKAVAIVRLDRIGDAAAAAVEGRPVTLTLPSWAPYRFGESAAAE